MIEPEILSCVGWRQFPVEQDSCIIRLGRRVVLAGVDYWGVAWFAKMVQKDSFEGMPWQMPLEDLAPALAG